MIIVDFETTGLLAPTGDPALQPGIVQAGFVEIDEAWEVLDKHLYLVNPEKLIEPEAQKAHGITDEAVRAAPPLGAYLPEWATMFRRHEVWVGFNNPFDRNVLFHQLMRYQWSQRFPWPSRDLDIMRIAKDVINIPGKRDVKFPNLTELHTALFGEGFPKAHDALADCLATWKCGKAIWEKGII